MLSIGKLVAGQARYYLDQAEGRVDAVQSIGDGIEDYYAGGAEARGPWLRRGGTALGLSRRRSTAMRFGASWPACDPRDEAPLRQSAEPRHRWPGFDLTFSAPKSVSVLFGLGDAETRSAVRNAHDAAVLEALGYLERSAAAVRRGRGGATVETASGLVAAAFRHRTSRAGDPQLHTHVLVANLGRGLGWAVVGARRPAALRARADRELRLPGGAARRAHAVARRRVDAGRDGIAEIDGVPREVMRAFSQRRAEIEAALAGARRVGTAGGRGRDAGVAAGEGVARRR